MRARTAGACPPQDMVRCIFSSVELFVRAAIILPWEPSLCKLSARRFGDDSEASTPRSSDLLFRLSPFRSSRPSLPSAAVCCKSDFPRGAFTCCSGKTCANRVVSAE